MIRRSNKGNALCCIYANGSVGSDDWWPVNYVSNNWTVEAWVYPTKTVTEWNEGTTGASAVNGNAMLIGPCNETTNRGGSLSVGTNCIHLFIHGTSVVVPIAKYVTSVSGWNHVVGVSTNKTGSIILNGSTVRTGQTCPTTHYYSPRKYIFWMDYGSFAGYTDEIRIWNYARTDAETLRDMYRRASPGEAGLLSLIRFYSKYSNPFDHIGMYEIKQSKGIVGKCENLCPYLPRI